MGIRMRDLLDGALGSLRYEACEKRLRLYLDGELVADTVNGLLVWEPRRLVPTYAVPRDDFAAQLESAGRVDDLADCPCWCRRIPLRCIPAPAKCSTSSSVIGDARRRHSGRTIPTWPATSALDFSAFEWRRKTSRSWLHPHDPFKRIDILASTRQIRIEWEGRLLAESSRPLLLFETLLPMRFYLPRADVVADLEPTDTRQLLRVQGPGLVFLGAGRSRGRCVDLSATRCAKPNPSGITSRSSTSGSTSSSTAYADSDPSLRVRLSAWPPHSPRGQAGRHHRPGPHRSVGCDLHRPGCFGHRAERVAGVGVRRHVLR